MGKSVLCEHCQALRGKGRKDKGHEFLEEVRFEKGGFNLQVQHPQG